MMERRYQSVRSYLNGSAPADAAAFLGLVAGPEARNIGRNLVGRSARLDRAAVLDLLQLAENIYADTAYMQPPHADPFTHPSARYFAALDRMRQLLIGVLDPWARQTLNGIMARIESSLRQQTVNDVEVATLCGDFYEEYARYVSRQHGSYAPPGAYSAPRPPEFTHPPPPDAYPMPPPPDAHPTPPPPPGYRMPPTPPPQIVYAPTPPPQAEVPPQYASTSPQPTRAFPTPPPYNAETQPGTFSRPTNEFAYFAQQPESQPVPIKPPVPPKPPHLQSRPNSAGAPTAAAPSNVPRPPNMSPPSVPPPPPNMPPPPPLDDLLLDAIVSEPRAPDRGALFDQIKKRATLKKAEPISAPVDPRGDLLDQIRGATVATLKKTGRLEDENLSKPTKAAPEGILGALYNTLGGRRGARGALSEESDLLSESASGYDDDPQIEKASKRDLKFAVHLFNFAKDSKLFNIQNITNKELEKILQDVSKLLRERPRTAANVQKAKSDLYLFRKSVVLPENALDRQPPVELYAADAPRFYLQIEDLIFAGRYDDARAFLQAVAAPDDVKLKNLLAVVNELSAA